jgi:hypothetical protein
LLPEETQIIIKIPYITTDLHNHIQVIQRHRGQGLNSGLKSGFEPSSESGPNHNHILDPILTLGPQPSPIHQTLHYIVKGYHMAQYEITLLEQENGRLHDENQWRRKKKEVRRSYVARGGLLLVEDGRQLASEKSKPTANSTTQQLYNKCKLPGYNRRTCSGIQDSIHVIIS